MSKITTGLPLSDSVNNTKGVLRLNYIDILRRQKPDCIMMFTVNNCGGCCYPLTSIMRNRAFAVLRSNHL